MLLSWLRHFLWEVTSDLGVDYGSPSWQLCDFVKL